jgi:hypothetical protein
MLVIIALRLWSGSLLGFKQVLLLLTSDPGDAVFSLGGWQGFLRSMSYSGESTSVAQKPKAICIESSPRLQGL